MSDDPQVRTARTTPPPSARRWRISRGPLGSLVMFTRGLILDQHLRRATMFYVVVAAMFMALVGDVFIDGWLRHPLLRFVIYWLACAWLTVLAALLAMYDLLMLRVQHRLLRRKLRQQMLEEKIGQPPHE
jgi:uncharacterized membrane protein YdcZ (DUF606 family)